MPFEEQRQGAPHLLDYWLVVRKHRWSIAVITACVVALFFLFTLYMDPVYKATATLVIEREQAASPLTGERIDYESYASQTLTFNTHFKLIESKPVLERVIEDLDLVRLQANKDLEISPLAKLVATVKRNVRMLLGKQTPVRTPEEKRFAVMEKLRSKIRIQQDRNTRLLRVSVVDKDPKRAQEIANSVARAYVEFNISNRMSNTRNTLAWVRNQAYAMKKQLEDSEQEFLEYKQNEKLFSLEGKQKLIAQKIEEFNDSSLKARNQRQEIEANLAQLRSALETDADVMEVRSIVENPYIDQLYSHLIQLEMDYSTLSKTFKGKHPKVVEVQTGIENARNQLKEEIRKEVQNLETKRAVLLQKENAFYQNVLDFEKEALETSEKELRYRILERNVFTNQKLYDTLLGKLKEANVIQDVDVSNIRISEEAHKPLAPMGSKKRLYLLLGLLLGLGLGVGQAFFREYMDQSFHTEDDIRRYTGLPVLAVIPLAGKEAREESRKPATANRQKPPQEQAPR